MDRDRLIDTLLRQTRLKYSMEPTPQFPFPDSVCHHWDDCTNKHPWLKEYQASIDRQEFLILEEDELEFLDDAIQLFLVGFRTANLCYFQERRALFSCSLCTSQTDCRFRHYARLRDAKAKVDIMQQRLRDLTNLLRA